MSEISSSMVSIRVFGKDLDPTEVTGLLGCQPTRAAKAGDIITKPNGQTRLIEKGFWILGYGERDSVELEKKVEGPLSKLTDDLNVWKQIAGKYRFEIFCGLFVDHWNEGFGLTPGLLTKIGNRNLEISFDIYAPTDSWDDDPEEESGRESPLDNG
jgi:hypothetical protein